MIDEADFLERCSEYLTLRQAHFLLDNVREPESAQEFVAYCLRQNEHDLHTPRAKDGLSFAQRRESKKMATRYDMGLRYADVTYPFRHLVDVYLNGVKRELVQVADADNGFIEVATCGDNGEILRNADREASTTREEGAVRIFFKGLAERQEFIERFANADWLSFGQKRQVI